MAFLVRFEEVHVRNFQSGREISLRPSALLSVNFGGSGLEPLFRPFRKILLSII